MAIYTKILLNCKIFQPLGTLGWLGVVYWGNFVTLTDGSIQYAHGRA